MGESAPSAWIAQGDGGGTRDDFLQPRSPPSVSITFQYSTTYWRPSIQHMSPRNKVLGAWYKIIVFKKMSLILILCMHACLCGGCATCVQVTRVARRGRKIHWRWSYRCLWATMWMLGYRLRSCGRASLNSQDHSGLSEERHLWNMRFWEWVVREPSLEAVAGYQPETKTVRVL